MTTKKRKPMTAAELMAELAEDPEYQARVAERDARINAADAAHRDAERPVVDALRSAGVAVQSVWDLVNEAAPYPEAVPTLLEHLQMPYPDRVREGIARALAVPDARPGWDILVSELEKSTDETTLGAKYGIALALAAAADVIDQRLSQGAGRLQRITSGPREEPAQLYPPHRLPQRLARAVSN